MHSSGDLVEDLTHNYFLETGARSRQAARLRDVRPPGGARADGLPARPRRRAPGRLRAGAREPDRRGHVQAVPDAADPDGQDPRVPAAHRDRASTSSSTASRPTTTARSSPSSTARTRRRARTLEVVDEAPGGLPAQRPAAADRRLRARLRARGDRRDRPEAAQGRRPAGQGHGHRRQRRQRRSSPRSRTSSPVRSRSRARGGRASAARGRGGRRCGRPPRAGCA